MQESLNPPLVSIIMPTYNRSALIIEAIKSIQSQTMSNWELIIIDDGSEDDTLQKVHDLHDQRIQFHQKKHTGILGSLKNDGLKAAKGDLIAFMDSDDTWMPGKLEMQIKALENNPGTSFCLTGGYTFNQEGNPKEYYYPQKTGFLKGRLLDAFFEGKISALMPTLLMRRSCYDEGLRFDENKKFSDNSFILTLASNYEGIVLFDPLLGRRLHDSNITNENWELGYTEYIDIINDFRSRKLITSSLAKKALVKTYIHYGDKCVKYGLRKKARENYLKALRLLPTNLSLYKKVFGLK